MIFRAFFALLLLGAGPAANVASEQVHLNGVLLDYEVEGEGPALYLLHGGMESRDSFNAIQNRLAQHFTVVALDSREQGRSGASSRQISYELMADDVAALAAHLGHREIRVIGKSDGGVTALTLAMRHPSLVKELVVSGAVYHFEAYAPETREFIANYRWDGNTSREGFPGMFIDHYLTGHEDLSGFGDLLREMAVMWTNAPTITAGQLGEIEQRVLIVNGDREDVPLDHVISMHAALPSSQLLVVPGADHFVFERRPQFMIREVLQFFAKDRVSLGAQ